MQYVVTILVALIPTLGTIITACISKKTSKKVDSISDLKNEFTKEMKLHILESDKTYLTDFLSEVEVGQAKSEIQKKRAYEIYEEYTSLHGNSYIHDKWEELHNKGLI